MVDDSTLTHVQGEKKPTLWLTYIFFFSKESFRELDLSPHTHSNSLHHNTVLWHGLETTQAFPNMDDVMPRWSPRWGKWSFLYVLMSSIISKEHSLLMRIAAVMRWDERCPLLVKREMTTGWRPDGKGSGQHTGVLRIHVLHAHDICTYSALVHRVIKRWLLCHVVIWWRGCWHSDRLPL